ncbi:oligosaccharide flippase family protein [Bacillus sp. RG28]|uniref:Oligosaccharide flippase family protein n=1 Tax=Gottfriedia endophytica TaxID=2820819 RepID=A0A940NL08_9BACI|nr:oligosaccharide flippase family protein [Gottfriedia endophytica]MBP0724476.1 oligosaccharide flippase family protein [Gottfriedia endophytica]
MRLIKDAYILFFVTALSAIVSFVTGIWMRNILGPRDYGVWLIFSLILTYGYYLQLGILDGFSREIPQLLGQKKYNQVKNVRSIVFTWMIFSSCIAIVGVFIILLSPLSSFDKVISIIAILLVPLQNLALYHNHLFLTTQQFNIVAIFQLIIGSLQYVLMAIFAMTFGIYGLFLGVLVGNSVAILYSRLKLSYKIKIKWDWKIFKGMLLYGIPITLIGILLNVFTTVDRILIFHFYGSVSVGHYGIVAFIYQGIMVLPGVFHQIMYPKISYKYGESGNKTALKSIIVIPTIYLSFFSPIILGTIYFMFPSFIKVFMPDYVGGIAAAKLIIIGMFFLIWATLFAHYHTVVKKVWTYFYVLLASVFLNVVLNLIFIKLGFNIWGVALGTAISYSVYPMVMMWFCFRDMGETVLAYFSQAALVMYPFLTMVCLLFFISEFHLNYLANLFIYLVSYLIFIFIASYHISLLITLRKKVIYYIKNKVGKLGE